jgi:hypothetical protein
MTEPNTMPTNRPTTCPGCGTSAGGGPFCGTCGLAQWAGADYLAGRPLPRLTRPRVAEPRPPRSGPNRVLLIAAAGVVGVVLIGGAVFLVQRSRIPTAAAPPTPISQIPPTRIPPTQPQTPTTELFSSAPPTDASAPPSEISVPSAPPSPTDENTAQADLQNQATGDQSQVEALNGSWVAELSAKTPGLVANGTTYDYESIWQDYQQQVAAHPGALLLNSSAYSTFKLGGYWVTVMAQRFASPADANAWCANQNIDANDCFAKLLSHAAGPQGSTVPRQ